jgi:hypothetical protein
VVEKILASVAGSSIGQRIEEEPARKPKIKLITLGSHKHILLSINFLICRWIAIQQAKRRHFERKPFDFVWKLVDEDRSKLYYCFAPVWLYYSYNIAVLNICTCSAG